MKSILQLTTSLSIAVSCAIASGCPELGTCVTTSDCQGDEVCSDGQCGSIPEPPRATILTFEAVPPQVTVGETINLEWTTANAETCTIGYDSATVDVDCDGTLDIVLEQTTQFRLTAFSPAGSSQRLIRASALPDCTALNLGGSTIDCSELLGAEQYCESVFGGDNSVENPNFGLISTCGTCSAFYFASPGVECDGVGIVRAPYEAPAPSAADESCYNCHAPAGYDGSHSIDSLLKNDSDGDRQSG